MILSPSTSSSWNQYSLPKLSGVLLVPSTCALMLWWRCAGPTKVTTPGNAVELNIVGLDNSSSRVNSDLIETFDRRDIHGKIIYKPLPTNLIAIVPNVKVVHDRDGRRACNALNEGLLAIERWSTLLKITLEECSPWSSKNNLLGHLQER